MGVINKALAGLILDLGEVEVMIHNSKALIYELVVVTFTTYINKAHIQPILENNFVNVIP